MKKADKIFTEIGIDPDNNKFIVGVSSEIEYKDGSEVRQSGFIKMKLDSIYIRLWVFKNVFAISRKQGIKIKKKNKNNFKFVFGLEGYPKY